MGTGLCWRTPGLGRGETAIEPFRPHQVLVAAFLADPGGTENAGDAGVLDGGQQRGGTQAQAGYAATLLAHSDQLQIDTALPAPPYSATNI